MLQGLLSRGSFGRSFGFVHASHSVSRFQLLQVVSIDLSRQADAGQEKLRLLLDFGEHAREFISAEVGLHFLQTMADASGLHAFLANHLSQDKADHLLALLECCVQFKVLPAPDTRWLCLITVDASGASEVCSLNRRVLDQDLDMPPVTAHGKYTRRRGTTVFQTGRRWPDPVSSVTRLRRDAQSLMFGT